MVTATNPQNMLKLSTTYQFGGPWHRWRTGASVCYSTQYATDGCGEPRKLKVTARYSF
ncbi:hypothetical protein [Xylophilus sp.]|uniref:hypothetical protein n=1 Tax=Xylophilus sp. TaxID=2653893 RepID=UPI0013B9BBAB|nr:hypothetical protein [Xylophilus sp.]KAF1048093.1 MAG: hypothetical protein GAK38_01564 [Xylophilus sp.]